MARRVFHWLLGALLLVSFVAVLPEHQERVSKPEFKPDYVPGHDRLNGQWQMRFASDGETPLVHAPSMVALPDGRLRAFWFAGNTAIASPAGSGSGAANDQTIFAKSIPDRITKTNSAALGADLDGAKRPDAEITSRNAPDSFNNAL